ncbi:MAG: ethanolamine utilization protein EutH [Hydrogeniiclostridium sp.]
MEQVIMWIMAAGAVVGGLDRLFGGRLGLGGKFEEGFLYLGPTALSMAGIICLAPLISSGLEYSVAPLCEAVGVDPALLGGILAIDMGGYQLSVDLARDPLIGSYTGIIVAAIFGCTITFTIPMGIGIIDAQDRPLFAKGILLGLVAMPVALVAGGLFCGLPPEAILRQNLPVVLLAALFLLGIWKKPDQMIRGFSIFASFIRFLITVGLVLGAVQYMTGFTMIPGMAPLEDAMAVVSSIGIVMLGSLPVSEILQRALRRPFSWAGKKAGINEASVAGLLIGMVSVIPVLTMLHQMDTRGKIVNVAFLVSAASTLAAHLGFTMGTEPQLAVALLAAKCIGGVAGALIALAATRTKKSVSAENKEAVALETEKASELNGSQKAAL